MNHELRTSIISSVAGAGAAGAAVGAVFGVATMIEAGWSELAGGLLFAIYAIGFGAVAGAVVGSLPAMAAAYPLARSGKTDIAPQIGAAAGTVLAGGLYASINPAVLQGPTRDLAAVALLSVCGLIGGVVGGLLLRSRIGTHGATLVTSRA